VSTKNTYNFGPKERKNISLEFLDVF
jgi:hypothetical protein